jgi:hypothetical protein
MKVICGCALALEEVADLAEFLSLLEDAAAVHGFLVKLFWEHMQVAETDVLIGRIHEQVDRHLAGRAKHHSLARRHHVVLIGLAAATHEALLA